jgi:inhibitor of KinA
MRLTSLGDQAWIVSLADEVTAVRLALAARNANPAWLQDVVPAYSQVGIYFDNEKINSAAVADWLKSLKIDSKKKIEIGRLVHVPICYELGLDIHQIAEQTRLSVSQVITEHLSIDYQVYAIGFVPGFPYLGYLSKSLSGVSRMASPRVKVEPGSVGVANRQTGIYPLARPGGWHLIGKTPVTIVDPDDNFFPLQVGDRVRFQRIDESVFKQMQGERLTCDPVTK